MNSGCIMRWLELEPIGLADRRPFRPAEKFVIAGDRHDLGVAREIRNRADAEPSAALLHRQRVGILEAERADQRDAALALQPVRHFAQHLLARLDVACASSGSPRSCRYIRRRCRCRRPERVEDDEEPSPSRAAARGRSRASLCAIRAARMYCSENGLGADDVVALRAAEAGQQRQRTTSARPATPAITGARLRVPRRARPAPAIDRPPAPARRRRRSRTAPTPSSASAAR